MVEQASSPKVVVVVLTWNDVDMTANCLSSILENDYDNFEVLLVDNGSDTPCGTELKERFPAIELMVLEKNRGFAGGSNAGLRRALELNPDYVHLIGNDAVLDPAAIRYLVAELEARPDFGGAGPLLFDPYEPGEERIVQFYWAKLNRERGRHEHQEMRLPFAGREWPTRESEFIPFVALMFRARVLEEVGLLDETFGTCWEDYDLVVRMTDAGWKLVAVGEAHAQHVGSATTGRVSPYITYYMCRNRLVCMWRHSSKLKLLMNVPFLARTMWWQMKEYGLTNWACHWALIKGVLYFMLGIRGERGAPKRTANKKKPKPGRELIASK